MRAFSIHCSPICTPLRFAEKMRTGSRPRSGQDENSPAIYRWAIFKRPLRGRKGTSLTGYETFRAKQLLFAESPADISAHRYWQAILSENGIPRPESEIADPVLQAHDRWSRFLCFRLS